MEKNQTFKSKIALLLILHVFLLISSLFGISSKIASQQEFLSIQFLIYYGVALLNLGVYAIVWQQIIKHMPLSTAYANKAIGIVWGVVWGVLFFKETITFKKIIAIVIIMTGIILVVTDKEERDD